MEKIQEGLYCECGNLRPLKFRAMYHYGSTSLYYQCEWCGNLYMTKG